jgi:hypothetical protein
MHPGYGFRKLWACLGSIAEPNVLYMDAGKILKKQWYVSLVSFAIGI